MPRASLSVILRMASPKISATCGTAFSAARFMLSSNASTFIQGATPWKHTAPPREQRISPYVQEHTDLVASLRAGTPLNELKPVAESTLTAIMGREAAYTGQEVTWDEMLNAKQTLGPSPVVFGDLAVPPVPMPGRTKIDRVWGAE